jgi:cytochrome bd-type quinol oxidase subunit 2
LVTSLFGLVHGLGFATGFLASNPEREQLLLPLLGFNLGLELAQLAVIGLLGAVILALKTRPRLTEWSADLAGSAACALGVYWFLERGFS